ncbi:MAG: fibronectin type III domain-containing protein, partial [bacterium]
KFLEEARVIGIIPSKDISDAEANTLYFTDTLPASGITTLRYRYAIRYTNLSGASLPLSNYALLEPTTAIAKAPESINTELTQEAIKLTWSSPIANLDETQPARIIGYNIYRRSKDGGFSDQPINNNLITSTNFDDRQFKFGNNYFYIVRSVSSGKDTTIESPDSAEVSIKAKDTFAPFSPSDVTGAAAAAIASLFWPANTEKDLRGYIVYRADKKDAPRSEWTKLTPTAITTTTFRDERAQVGKTYVYFITAIDIASNESNPSEGTEVEVVQ